MPEPLFRCEFEGDADLLARAGPEVAVSFQARWTQTAPDQFQIVGGSRWSLNPAERPFVLTGVCERTPTRAARVVLTAQVPAYPDNPQSHRLASIAATLASKSGNSGSLAACQSGGPAPGWERAVLRAWGFLFSCVGGMALAVSVCWAYGLVLLKTHPNPLPAFYGVARLSDLPDPTLWRSAIFVALTAGGVFGGLFSLFLVIVEALPMSAVRLTVVMVMLEVLSLWVLVTRDNWIGALPCAAVLPWAVLAGYRVVWWLRWRNA